MAHRTRDDAHSRWAWRIMLPLSPSQCLADASSTVPLPFGSLADVLSSKSSSYFFTSYFFTLYLALLRARPPSHPAVAGAA